MHSLVSESILHVLSWANLLQMSWKHASIFRWHILIAESDGTFEAKKDQPKFQTRALLKRQCEHSLRTSISMLDSKFTSQVSASRRQRVNVHNKCDSKHNSVLIKTYWTLATTILNNYFQIRPPQCMWCVQRPGKNVGLLRRRCRVAAAGRKSRIRCGNYAP